MSITNGEHIDLPFSILSKLLTGFPELEGIVALSPSIGDYAKPKVIPKELGELISSIDRPLTKTQKPYFHIVAGKNESKEWCELWTYNEWEESNAKRDSARRAATERIQVYEISKEEQAIIRKEQEKTHQLIELLADELAGNFDHMRRDPMARAQLATSIAKNYKDGRLATVIKTLNLYEVLEQYEKQSQSTQ